MSQLDESPDDLQKNATKKKDGDQLYKPDEDFKALMGDDEDTVAFVFQHVNPEDEGTLTCVARTTRGILSFGAVVQGEVEHGEGKGVEKSPKATQKPFRHWQPSLVVEKTDIIVNEGDQAMLQVQINGYPKPDMRCTFEDLPIKPSKKYKIYHEDEEHVLLLVIKDVHFEDAGVYTIMAENEIGFDSVDIILTVIRQKYPELKTKIEDLSIDVDQVLIMPVEVDGNPQPDVQFLKEGREIIPSEHIKVIDDYPTYTLVISNTTLKDTGVYSVAATNCLAQVSQFWGVYVYSKPKLIHKLGPNIQISQEETILLRTKIESEPKASIKWLKNDQELVYCTRFIIDDEEGFYLLKIKDVVIGDAAVYKFRAENAYGFVEDEIRIDVKKAPTITEAFQDAEVLEQDVYHIIHAVVFAVRLEAFPKPTVKWYLDGDELLENIQELTRIETADTIKLIINEPTTELSGEYICKISNECGKTQACAKLTVNCSPKILISLNDLTIEENFTLRLEIVVRGYPSPRFKWFRNNQELAADERIQIGLETYGKKKYRITCTITDISYAERGEYEVEVTNSFGSAKSKCLINVLTKPIILEAQMTDMVVKEGSNITYTIRAFSNPLPEAVWTWEGEHINSEDRNKLITSHNGVEFRMGIRKARMIDAGVYQCVLSNSVGMTRFRVALAVLRRKSDDSDDENVI